MDLSDNTGVNAGNSNTQTLTPPTGKIYTMAMIYYHAPDPAGSSSGTHDLTIKRVYVSIARQLAIIKATTGNDVTVGSNTLWSGDSNEQPSNVELQYALTHGGLIASNSYPIQFIYNNDTDVAQAGTRTCEILVREYNEV